MGHGTDVASNPGSALTNCVTLNKWPNFLSEPLLSLYTEVMTALACSSKVSRTSRCRRMVGAGTLITTVVTWTGEHATEKKSTANNPNHSQLSPSGPSLATHKGGSRPPAELRDNYYTPPTGTTFRRQAYAKSRNGPKSPPDIKDRCNLLILTPTNEREKTL